MTEDKLLEILAKLIVILDGNKVLSEVTDVFNEMLCYKNIEDKLGIDLITLLRVQTVGAYFIDVDKKWIPMTDYNEKCFKLTDSKIYRFYFKDYGKTWALTKEELL